MIEIQTIEGGQKRRTPQGVPTLKKIENKNKPMETTLAMKMKIVIAIEIIFLRQPHPKKFQNMYLINLLVW